MLAGMGEVLSLFTQASHAAFGPNNVAKREKALRYIGVLIKNLQKYYINFNYKIK